MSDFLARGRIVFGQVQSSDASSGVAVPLFDRDGNSVSVPSDKRLVVTDLIITGGASDVRLFYGTEANGKYVARTEGEGAAISFNIPRVGGVGETLTAKTGSAASVAVQIHGYLSN